MARILVIDDEPGIVRLIRRALESDGHTIIAAHDGVAGLKAVGEQEPDLVVLDLLMPGVGGLGVLAALTAEHPGTKVVVISAVGDVAARVRCLELGAADFLSKPFAVSELLARVRSRLREIAPVGGSGAEPAPAYGSVQLDTRSRQLHVGDATIQLSARESALMHHLIRHAGQVCSRAELLSEVWGYGFDPGSNVVDVTVARLRAKAGELAIETVRNVGYRLESA